METTLWAAEGCRIGALQKIETEECPGRISVPHIVKGGVISVYVSVQRLTFFNSVQN